MSGKIEISDYKLCKQCGETKPRTSKFFRVRNEKYFWSPCLSCINLYKVKNDYNKKRREKRRKEYFFKVPNNISNNKSVAMYALLDVNGNTFYIGKSVMPVTRLKAHKKKLKNVYSMNILEWTTQELWPQREKFYIASFRSMGFDISNVSDGGAGPNGWKMPIEAVKKSWETRRKNGTDCWSDQQRNSFIQTSKDHKCKPETRAKISKAHKGKSLSLEHRQKLKGHPVSPETRKKISETLKRRKTNVSYGTYSDSIERSRSIENGS